jgi:hypothetical protein
MLEDPISSQPNERGTLENALLIEQEDFLWILKC